MLVTCRKEAETAFQTAKKVTGALDDAREAQQKAKEAIDKANRDIDVAENDLTQVWR